MITLGYVIFLLANATQMTSIKLIAALFTWSITLIFSPAASGTCFINSEDFQEGSIAMNELARQVPSSKQESKHLKKEEKNLLRTERLVDRLTKALHSKMQKKSLGSISDPVDKWFWIWAIAWSIGIIMTIIAGGAVGGSVIGIIWLALFVIGAVALILWLVKKFGQ